MWYHLVEEKTPMKMIGAVLKDHQRSGRSPAMKVARGGEVVEVGGEPYPHVRWSLTTIYRIHFISTCAYL
jgi:hypothetical protein